MADEAGEREIKVADDERTSDVGLYPVHLPIVFDLSSAVERLKLTDLCPGRSAEVDT